MLLTGALIITPERNRQTMQRRADLFFQQLKDKKVTFIGMGVSHFECIKLFAQKGIRVTVADKRTAAQLGEKQEELAGWASVLHGRGISGTFE